MYSSDTSDTESVEKAKVEVEKKLGNNRGLNCLINNAAVNKYLRWNDINEKDMLYTYTHNTLGPWRVTKIDLQIRV
jgi:short-subunit dehydrogenase